MPGVRIQHPTARNARFTIAERDRPFLRPYQCTPPEFGGCAGTHLFKTHHLNIDENGAVIVESVLFQKIKGLLELNGFTVANEVLRPPAIGISINPLRPGTGSWGNVPIIRGKS